MAELALGGIELAIRHRVRPAECVHDSVLTVATPGVERSICETCGHISVNFSSVVSGPVTRHHFARPADEAHAANEPTDNPFADEERLGVRRRSDSDPLELIA
ncbi:MAG: hypothetical protein PVG83_05970 [Acidimicrobiia bacterium]|jgi:hypothetical protein